MPVLLIEIESKQLPYGHSSTLSMPKASVGALAALVDDVRFAIRLPKHLIMGAVVSVLQPRQAKIEAEARSAAGNG
jgi:hypothetical protein